MNFQDPVVQQNATFVVSASIWDEALDAAAETAVLSGFTWTCSIVLTGNDAVLSGTTDINVAAGSNEVKFDDLLVEQAGLSYGFDISCDSPELPTITLAVSADPFHVYDFPTTNMKVQTVTVITYTGPKNTILPLMNLASRKKRETVAAARFDNSWSPFLL